MRGMILALGVCAVALAAWWFVPADARGCLVFGTLGLVVLLLYRSKN